MKPRLLLGSARYPASTHKVERDQGVSFKTSSTSDLHMYTVHIHMHLHTHKSMYAHMYSTPIYMQYINKIALEEDILPNLWPPQSHERKCTGTSTHMFTHT